MSQIPRHDLLSIDVDDLLICTAQFYGHAPPAGYRSRLVDEVARTIEALDDAGARATFFVNAQYCDGDDGRIPRLVLDHGHAIATHGYGHGDLRKLTLAEFEADLARSLEILRRYEPKIVGYRPPAYSMPSTTDHYRVLLDHGIEYLSTGVERARKGEPPTPPGVRILPGGLASIPVSCVSLLGGRLTYPIGYGIVARLLPDTVYFQILDTWLRRHSYFHFYFHPFELAGLPRGPQVRYPDRWFELTPKIYRLRCSGQRRLFDDLFERCRFVSIEEYRRESESRGKPWASRTTTGSKE